MTRVSCGRTAPVPFHRLVADAGISFRSTAVASRLSGVASRPVIYMCGSTKRAASHPAKVVGTEHQGGRGPCMVPWRGCTGPQHRDARLELRVVPLSGSNAPGRGCRPTLPRRSVSQIGRDSPSCTVSRTRCRSSRTFRIVSSRTGKHHELDVDRPQRPTEGAPDLLYNIYSRPRGGTRGSDCMAVRVLHQSSTSCQRRTAVARSAGQSRDQKRQAVQTPPVAVVGEISMGRQSITTAPPRRAPCQVPLPDPVPRGEGRGEASACLIALSIN